jgi:photosystem II stability/assembly factor-like uncharacterized protein
MLKKFILILFFFLFSSSFSFAGEWSKVDSFKEYIEDSLQLGYINQDIDCYDKNNCIAVGNLGLCEPWGRHTTDGGRTWKTVIKDTIIIYYDENGKWIGRYDPPEIRAVDYVSPELCIAVGDTGYYWRSTDNCQTWVKGKLETNDWHGNKVFFLDNKYGGIITLQSLFITTDGGLNWNYIKINLPDSLNFITIEDISIPEKNVIILNCDKSDTHSYIIRSDDGGATWSAYPKIPKRANNIFFSDSKNGWVVGRPQKSKGSAYMFSVIYKTIDGGKSWEAKLDSMVFPYSGLKYVKFTDKNNGIASGYSSNLWKTNDGGETWIQDRYPIDKIFQTDGFLTEFTNPETGIIYASGESNGVIYKYEEVYDIEEINNSSIQFILYPNPSNNNFNIQYFLNNYSYVRISLYNSIGELCEILSEGSQEAAGHNQNFTLSRNYSPGIYWVKLETGYGKVMAKPVVMGR